MFEQLRDGADLALRRKGMIVGLPKVSVDASQLKSLLNHHDAYKKEYERLATEIFELRDMLRENIGYLRAAGCESLADMVEGSLRGEEKGK